MYLSKLYYYEISKIYVYEISLPILKVNELFCIFLSQNNAGIYFDNKYFLL